MIAKGYTNKTQIENYLLITINETFNEQIDTWISQMESHIEKMTGRVFIADEENSDRYFDGDATREILINDCVSVDKVYLNDVEIDSADYKLYPANTIPKKKIVYPSNRFLRGDQNVKVSAKWGYSENCPFDITLAATVLVSGIINYAWSSEGEVQSMTIGRYSVTYKNEKQWQDFQKVEEILTYYQKQIV